METLTEYRTVGVPNNALGKHTWIRKHRAKEDGASKRYEELRVSFQTNQKKACIQIELHARKKNNNPRIIYCKTVPGIKYRAAIFVFCIRVQYANIFACMCTQQLVVGNGVPNLNKNRAGQLTPTRNANETEDAFPCTQPSVHAHEDFTHRPEDAAVQQIVVATKQQQQCRECNTYGSSGDHGNDKLRSRAGQPSVRRDIY